MNHNSIFMYVGLQGGGCVDVGKIKLEGYSLIADETLAEIQKGGNGHLIATLNVAAAALRTPQGAFKTRKAREAFALIQEVLGPSFDPHPRAMEAYKQQNT